VQLDEDRVVEMGPGFRLQWEPAQQRYVLLYTEGMVRLNRSAGEILKRCDGSRTATEITLEVKSAFGHTDVEQDTRNFMEDAYGRGWIRYKPTT
jgi:pyrroloquinoline quinone biosynthesis protein D